MRKHKALPGSTPFVTLVAVAVFGLGVATAHHRVMEIYDPFGVQLGDSIEIVLFDQLHSLTNGFVVVDGHGGVLRRARIYNNFGEQQGQDIHTDGQAGVASKNNVIGVFDDTGIQFYTVFGNPLGARIDTDGRANLFPVSETIWVVTDSQRARIFNNLGRQIGATIDTNLRPAIKPKVAIGNTRLAVSDFGRVRIFDALGALVGAPIATTAGKMASLNVTKNGVFIVTDDSSVRFYDLLGTQLGGTVAVGLPPTVVLAVGRIILVENTRVRIYLEDDGELVNEIDTLGPGLPTVVTSINRIVIVDDDQRRLRFHGLSGDLIRTIVASSRAEVKVTVNNRFVVVEDDRATILDPFGTSVNDNIPTVGRADVAHATDKIFITDDRQVRIFDHFGAPRGQTFDTGHRAKLIANISAIGFNADNQFQIYNHLRETIGTTIATQGTVGLAASNDRIAISYDHGQGGDVAITGLNVSNDGPTMLGRATTLGASVDTGTNVRFVWNLGDGNIQSGDTVTHTYQATGSFKVILTASNSVGDVTRQTTVNVVDPQESVNLKVNGLDAEFPSRVFSTGPARLSLDMTAGSDVFDHYFAIVFSGTTYWVTAGGLSITPAPFRSFEPLDLTDAELFNATLVPGEWIFAWVMLSGAVVVDWDVILVTVSGP